ncbi:MAG: DUF2779 domain-containing protein [Nanoarchaeota archaeon]|nr:DUF2779 domain-containing protein [Nanoarchaeota archaeon]
MLLTKSRYMIGLQCPKCLWIMFNEPKNMPEPNENALHRFEEGNIIGELAKKCFPKGVDIPVDDFKKNMDKTKKLVEQRKIMFEGGFLYGEVFSRADVLVPVGKKEWDIIEVKSGARVKNENIEDVSFQKYCYEKCGLKIRKCFLMHVNTRYVKKGKIYPKKLMIKEDITGKVNLNLGVEERVNGMLKLIKLKKKPDMTIGRFCKNPYVCTVKGECWSFLPKNHVFNLHRGGEKSEELFGMGVQAIKDIPDHFKLNEKQSIQKKCELGGTHHIDKDKIKGFIDKLEYPLYYMDFETINPAIPLYDGMKPYQRIPFQFSVHIVDKPGGKPKHISFLHDSRQNPRPNFTKELMDALGEKGSVIVYYEAFEKGVLSELAKALPKHRKSIESALKRIEDLIKPFNAFHCYHPDQQGSASIKNVLPAMTGKGYSDMGIGDGATASILFTKVNYGDVSEKEKKKVRADLEKYCCLDTEGMIWIMDKLREMVEYGRC